MNKRSIVPAAVLIAQIALLAGPASARDLVLLLETRQHNRVLLDRDSLIQTSHFDRRLRQAVVSIDNSLSMTAADLYAADVQVQADCETGELAVVWARAYGRDGSPASGASAPVPHELARPTTLFERTALKGICQS